MNRAKRSQEVAWSQQNGFWADISTRFSGPTRCQRPERPPASQQQLVRPASTVGPGRSRPESAGP